MDFGVVALDRRGGDGEEHGGIFRVYVQYVYAVLCVKEDGNERRGASTGVHRARSGVVRARNAKTARTRP